MVDITEVNCVFFFFVKQHSHHKGGQHPVATGSRSFINQGPTQGGFPHQGFEASGMILQAGMKLGENHDPLNLEN